MIEVEKQFLVDDTLRQRLLEGAVFQGAKRHRDEYYDTDDLQLARKNWWIRTRNGAWEMKIPVLTNSPESRNGVRRYHEIESEAEIRHYLELTEQKTLAEDLQARGIRPRYAWVVERQTYAKDKFRIDVDRIDFDYDMVEIELLVADESQVATATQRIIDFAQTIGLSSQLIRDKSAEYFYRHRPQDYAALVQAGVFIEAP